MLASPAVEKIPISIPETSAFSRGLVNLAGLGAKELDFILQRRVLGLPILLRNLLILKQTGLKEIFVLYSAAQDEKLATFKSHRLLKDHFFFCPIADNQALHSAVLGKFSQTGGYILQPQYLLNGVFLKAFATALGPTPKASLIETRQAGRHFLWAAANFFKGYSEQNSWEDYLRVSSSTAVTLTDREATGVFLKDKGDIKAAEKLVFADVVRKKGGLIAKVLNEPVSLRIAKYVAKTPITPNQVTLINTVLGLMSAALIYYSGMIDRYWPMALGAILFYLVDIFDGIDGELARFTYRFSPRGALYDTISDNLTLLSFLIACGYKAFTQMQSVAVFLVAGLAVFLFVSAVLYLYVFCMKHFKDASLRHYEARFLPLVPKENAFIRFIFLIRHCYTKDVFCAFFSVLLLFNQPLWIFHTMNIFALLMFVGFVYLGRNYSHLIAAQKSA